MFTVKQIRDTERKTEADGGPVVHEELRGMQQMNERVMHIGERSEVIKQKAMEQLDIINLRYTPYLYLGCNLHILAIFSIV